jgi:hypothetical protein
VIFYGSWPTETSETQLRILEFLVNVGSSSYFKINTIYSDALGNTPSGAVFYGGAITKGSDFYGTELGEEDLQAIIGDAFFEEQLPIDVNGIYLVIGSQEIGSEATGFCSQSTGAHHNYFSPYGIAIKYAFVGDASRCPAIAAPQFVATDGSLLPTPNGDFVADAMVSSIASSLNAAVSNPLFTGWYDRNGLENATKCAGEFGQTYTMPNGAQANVRLGQRDFLIQQNWVNSQVGYCAMSLP